MKVPFGAAVFGPFSSDPDVNRDILGVINLPKAGRRGRERGEGEGGGGEFIAGRFLAVYSGNSVLYTFIGPVQESPPRV